MTNLKNTNSSSFWSFYSLRFYMAFLMMFLYFSTITMRDNMGIAVVCMVNKTSYQKDTSTISQNMSIPEKCITSGSFSKLNHPVARQNLGTFDWTPNMQSVLFSALFYGSFTTVLFSGYISDKYGPNFVIITGLILYIALSILAPTMAEFSFYALVATRFVMGLAEGSIQPAIAAMVPRWFPNTERSTASAIYTSGQQLGTGFITLIGANLCLVPFMHGWPLIFYVGAIFGIIFAIFWCFLASNNPYANKYMSNREKEYLMMANGEVQAKSKNFKVPWYKMLTSIVTISVLISGFALEFQYTLIQSFLPQYLRDVLYFDIETNGLFSTIPFFTQLISKNILSILVDKWKQTGFMSLTNSCKILQAFAAFGTSVILITLGLFVDCTKSELTLFLLIMFGLCFAARIPCIWTVLLNIAPNYSGTLMSVYKFIQMIARVVTPSVVGVLNRTSSQQDWTIIFGVASAINIFAGGFFMIFGSAETQEWNYVDNNSIQSEISDLPEVDEDKPKIEISHT